MKELFYEVVKSIVNLLKVSFMEFVRNLKRKK
ncbi:hypothetical protein KCTC32420_02898 [Aequorivita nionensis]|jgi:hypothetical protein